jgi:hypothetical protein
MPNASLSQQLSYAVRCNGAAGHLRVGMQVVDALCTPTLAGISRCSTSYVCHQCMLSAALGLASVLAQVTRPAAAPPRPRTHPPSHKEPVS